MNKGFWFAAAALGVVAGAAAAVYAMVKREGCCCDDCCDCCEDDELLDDVDPNEYCKPAKPVEAEEEDPHFRSVDHATVNEQDDQIAHGERGFAPQAAAPAPDHATVNDEELKNAINEDDVDDETLL